MLLLAVVMAASLTSSSQSLHVVQLTHSTFDPEVLRITAGDTVEWVNETDYHNVNGSREYYRSNLESFGNAPGTDWTYRFVFDNPGTYDYHCDPHLSVGMRGQVIVSAKKNEGDPLDLWINFDGMTALAWQDLYLAVREKTTGIEIGRVHEVIEAEFTLLVQGIEEGKSYYIDIWADTNENGRYDSPPTDQAWRLELNNVTGDTTLTFSHNTDFTDIMWKNLLTVEFSGMNPHEGQNLYLALKEKSSGMEIVRIHEVAEPEFSVMVPGIEPGMSYYIDFWADFNENGMYDTPPTDHAWRLELDDVDGDTTLMFIHNTDFTDIMWKNLLTVEFEGMNPHVGQDLYLAVVDKNSGMEAGRTHTVADTSFTVMVPGIEQGKSYFIDFWVDFNENGTYDTPPTDHAWRLDLDDVTGDTTLMFSHNTDFTDIMWKYLLTVEFSAMNPHIGQDLYLAVIDAETGKEAGRTHATVDASFNITLPVLEHGKSYHVDFWADFNVSGVYDIPPTDHAWRLELNDVAGDTTLTFTHNTDFTDIMWRNRLTVEFSGMTPHIGQMMVLYVVDADDETVLDTVTVDAIQSADFSVHSSVLMAGGNYHINFFADFNDNRMYDTPPVDHAWQIALENVTGDTTVVFMHNTDFTDIFPVTSVFIPGNLQFRMFPNPARDKVWIEVNEQEDSEISLSVFDYSGRLTAVKPVIRNNRFELNIGNLTRGVYFVELKSPGFSKTMKLIKQ